LPAGGLNPVSVARDVGRNYPRDFRMIEFSGGPGALRAWLVQCAWAAVRHGHDEALRHCFERLEPRAGRKKAIVAVARKLALRLRARWLEFEAAATTTVAA
jgi:hypothetical protein